MHRALQGRCGLFCGNCEVYIAYATDDIEGRKKIAAKQRELRPKPITPEQVKCLGCKGPDSPWWSGKCKIRSCAEERGVEFCYQSRVYPCDILKEFHEQHPNARENLRTISKQGPDAWLLQMMTRNRNKDIDDDSD